MLYNHHLIYFRLSFFFLFRSHPIVYLSALFCLFQVISWNLWMERFPNVMCIFPFVFLSLTPTSPPPCTFMRVWMYSRGLVIPSFQSPSRSSLSICDPYHEDPDDVTPNCRLSARLVVTALLQQKPNGIFSWIFCGLRYLAGYSNRGRINI